MIIRKSNERGHASHGWLDSFHTFSFADYHDPKWMGFHSLRVINDDLVLPGKGFGMHPHADMEIITYILEGSLEHKDSMGNRDTIHTGELQYMAAGTGILHSEYNPSPDEAVHLLQIWIRPDTKGVVPRYGGKSFADAPTGVFHLAASKAGHEGSIAIHQDADLRIAKLATGDRTAYDLIPGRHAWVHIAEGAVELNGTPLEGGDAAALDGSARLEFTATRPSQILLFDLN